jgi:peptidoglycan/LPS O-acetylase OafA/YrhL
MQQSQERVNIGFKRTVEGMTFSADGYRSVDLHSQSYRPDIDALRAIAVSAVIAYHIDEKYLPGGFLGVDIFFVISGFLITSIIMREIGRNGFSTVGFYDRRIRRLIPALLLIMSVTTIGVSLLFIPADLVNYGGSLLSSLLFVANVWFWRDGNYFAPIAEIKPLLHLWSLSVEEQFYLVFPLILLAASRLRISVLLVVLAIVLTSYGLNYFLLISGGANPAFYLLPTRAWELALGAAVALMPIRPVSGFLREALTLVGLVGVAVSLYFGGLFDGSSIPAATAAAVGTALLLWIGGTGGWIVRAMSVRPIIFVGRISYSLYLWHWPLIVLPRYYLVRAEAPLETVLMVAAMIGAATLSWRFVERPFRQSSMPVRSVRLTALAGSVALAAAGLLLILARGLPQRINPVANDIAKAIGTNYR